MKTYISNDKFMWKVYAIEYWHIWAVLDKNDPCVNKYLLLSMHPLTYFRLNKSLCQVCHYLEIELIYFHCRIQGGGFRRLKPPFFLADQCIWMGAYSWNPLYSGLGTPPPPPPFKMAGSAPAPFWPKFIFCMVFECS